MIMFIRPFWTSTPLWSVYKNIMQSITYFFEWLSVVKGSLGRHDWCSSKGFILGLLSRESSRELLNPLTLTIITLLCWCFGRTTAEHLVTLELIFRPGWDKHVDLIFSWLRNLILWFRPLRTSAKRMWRGVLMRYHPLLWHLYQLR